MSDNYKATIYTFIVIGFILILVGGLILYHPTDLKPASTFNPDYTGKVASQSPAPEPAVAAWRTYSNATYNFSIDVPSDWHEQEYPSAQPNGGFVVAFGPNNLPCSTCTYFRNGYYSVRVFNQKSDPDYYKDLQGRMASIGKSKDFQGIMFGEYKGVINTNTVAIDHKDWVFEMALDTSDGNLKVNDSKIFQKAIMSFKFTNLLFNK